MICTAAFLFFTFNYNNLFVISLQSWLSAFVFVIVLNTHLTGDMNHKHSGRLPLFSASPAVTLASLKRAATNFTAC